MENDTNFEPSDTVRVSRRLDAPPERVWRALTDGEELAAWYWPQSLQPSATVDLRTGGRYRISSAATGMAVSGDYHEVSAPRRLVESWQWDGEDITSLVTIDLSGDDEHTDVVVIHERLAAEAVAAHHQGWSDCLDRLPGHLA
ncbi:MAG: hypothetical protein AUI14_25790 [Actinobacteria bacterium 13_2_20CM_2_71_6]|nr:MAG: hypothetical protein AUI14_25790 [Actinobacteria bacterium 13_2_20CM_2_71_6]